MTLEEPVDQPAISRRTLARAAHWAVPVVIASTAAPAIAASAEPATMLWSGFPRRTLSSRIDEPATQAVGGVRIATDLDRPSLAHAGNNWTPTADGRLELRSNRVTVNDSEQIITLRFDVPVTHVSLTVEDLDREGRSNMPHFQDEVFVPAGSSMFSGAQKGFYVIGEGTADAPFRADDGLNGDLSGPDHNVTLSWDGPVSEIRIVYRQGVRANLGAYPTIWLSPVTFTPPAGL
ncbi:MAG: hypothetical protein ACTHWF_14810 [Brachybacterium sp.]